jgi:GcrA cell cycle regulator
MFSEIGIMGRCSSWSNEDVILLTELWLRGDLTAKQIAEGPFGGRFTRNAVTGKANRLGLIKKRLDDGTPPPRQQIPNSGFMTVRLNQARHKRKPPTMPATSATEMGLEEVPATAITLFEAGPDHCRWPFGHPRSPDFRFCGAPITRPSRFSYCQYHNVIAMHTGRPRR